jgi:hypothetical protein
MRTARSISPLRLIFGLALSAGLALFISHLAKDMIADANKRAGFENIPANVRNIDDSQSLYRAENFGAALAALEERAGKHPKLLEVGVMPHMATFQVKDGQRAKGYRYYAKSREMGAFKVKLVGPGSIEGLQFPYRTIGAGVPERLASSAAGQGNDLKVTNMTIRRDIIDGHLEWSLNADSDERTGIVFTADPDGSGLADPVGRAIDRATAGR